MRQIVLDTETTGLHYDSGDRIIEIGCVELIDRRRTENNLHLYINPERQIEAEAFKVHGISDEFLADKAKFAQVAQELLDYLAGAELIIHNAPFDMGFLNMEFQRCNLPMLNTKINKVTDTLALAKELFPGKRNSLDMLCERYQVDNSNRALHGALLDAQLLAEVYIAMTREQKSLFTATASIASTTAKAHSNLQDLALPTLLANEQELAEHEQILQLIDKKSDANTLWRTK